MRRQKSILVAASAFLLTLYPTVIAWRISGMSSFFSAFAADAFYYLAVAKHVSWTPLFSFDTIYPTNGFHPLWQALLKAGFSGFAFLGGNQTAQVVCVALFGSACVSVAAALLADVVYRLTRNSVVSLLTVVPGYYYLLAVFTNTRYGSLWSFANGTESPLSLLLFSILVWVIIRCRIYSATSLARYFLVSLLVSMLVLARLDDVFLVPCLLLPLLWRRSKKPGLLPAAVALGAAPALTVAAYCALNVKYVGVLLPVSGSLKRGFALKRNIAGLVDVFSPLEQFWGNNWENWSGSTWRAMQVVVPMVAALIFLSVWGIGALKRKKAPGSLSSVLAAICFYVVCKGLYNFVIVDLWDQGHWYFPVSIAVFNMLVALVLTVPRRHPCVRDYWTSMPLRSTSARGLFVAAGTAVVVALVVRMWGLLSSCSVAPAILGRYSVGRAILVLLYLLCAVGVSALTAAVLRRVVRAIPVPVSLCLVAVLVVYVANTMVAQKAVSAYNSHFYSFWQNRQSITENVRLMQSGRGVLSFDDGIVAYSLDLPVMSGLGFTLDPEGIHAKKSGQLLSLAYERGFRWLTSVNYMPPMPLTEGADVADHLRGAFWLSREAVDRWEFRLAYVVPQTGTRFVEFRPKHPEE